MCGVESVEWPKITRNQFGENCVKLTRGCGGRGERGGGMAKRVKLWVSFKTLTWNAKQNSWISLRVFHVYLSIFICSIETIKHNNWKEQWNRTTRLNSTYSRPITSSLLRLALYNLRFRPPCTHDPDRELILPLFMGHTDLCKAALYQLRKRQHPYLLPTVQYSQFKNCYINRCLFKYV